MQNTLLEVDFYTSYIGYYAKIIKFPLFLMHQKLPTINTTSSAPWPGPSINALLQQPLPLWVTVRCVLPKETSVGLPSPNLNSVGHPETAPGHLPSLGNRSAM